MSNNVQIHHTVESWEEKWVMDGAPSLGKRREKVQAPSDNTLIVHGGHDYEVQPDGSFLVPPDVADFMARLPGWERGPSPFAPEAVAARGPRVTRKK